MDDVHHREDVPVEMRDGARLAADVYLPADAVDGGGDAVQALPTLVSRTPYDKTDAAETAATLARHDYAVVIQDVRGKFASDGDFYPYRSEGLAETADSYDTVEWAAAQPWSTGAVGTFGSSYLAATQWALAHNDALPPSLEAMAPGFAVASYYGQGAYAGGVPLLSHNIDYLNQFAVERFDRDNPEEGESIIDHAQAAMPQLFWDLPVDPYEPFEEIGYPWLADWHGHETYGEFWHPQDHTRHYDTVDVPVLNFGGWYDIFVQGTVRNYQGLCEEAATEAARDAAALVVGPHTHADTASKGQGQLCGHAHQFPDNSTYERADLLVSWFDRHLKDADRCDETSRVRLYVPGLDEWIGASEFPLPETDRRRYYLHSDGDAGVDAVTADAPEYAGRLTTDSPREEPPDEYTYDPADPVVTVGGYNTHWNGGVADRATAYQDRDDILVYETARLDEPVAVVGPITVTLYAETSAVDTDFVAALSDVGPSERAGGIWIGEGARRGRIGDVEADPRRPETYAEVDLLEPGKVYAWQIAIWPTARVFEAGRRIRLDIASSNFPRYARNLNTAEGLAGAESVSADQTIYHDQDHPSHVEIPVVPMAALKDRVIDGPIPGVDKTRSS